MQRYFLAFIIALVAYTSYSFIYRFIKNRRDAAQAERLGCKPAALLPNKLPLGVDHIRDAIKADNARQFVGMMRERCAKMGTLTHQYNILGTTGFMTTDPKNLQAILATQFHDFELGQMRIKNFQPLLGTGIFSADGKQWEHSRAMLRPQFARDQVSNLVFEEQHVQNMMRALPIDSTGWTPEVDLQVLFFRLTLDSACEFLFGESVDSQINNLPGNTSAPSTKSASRDEKVFAKAFDTSQRFLASRARLLDHHWLLNTPEFRKSNKDVHTFIDYFVDLALNKELKEKESKKGNINHEKDRYVFLDALVAQTRDPIELRSQALNILLAGRDTTASFLGWLFYVLVRNPGHFTKLRNAVIDSFGTYNDSAEITFVSLKNCQYLQHCLNETLRLYSVVPVNSRMATRDTTIPCGGGPDGMGKVFVRKGEQVDYSVQIMHRDKQFWGPDADEFKPERWVGRKPGWEYLPFNGGPRICLGRMSSPFVLYCISTRLIGEMGLMSNVEQFALTEASYVTVRLLQRFDGLENRDPEVVTKHNLTLTDCSATGVKLRLHEARA